MIACSVCAESALVASHLLYAFPYLAYYGQVIRERLGLRSSSLSFGTEYVLRRMFREVGDTFSEERVRREGWWTENEWTREQEDAFADWLADLLVSNRRVRRDLMGLHGKPDRWMAERAARSFILQYGWKLSEERVLNRENKEREDG